MSLCLVSCLIACHLIFLAVINDVQYAYVVALVGGGGWWLVVGCGGGR